jgi:hypothetical protein
VNLKKCQDCKNEYQDQDAKHFGHCPNCDSTFFTLVQLREVPTSTSKKPVAKDLRSELPTSESYAQVTDIDRLIAAQNKTTLDLIAAQNKTTHAVRAFVRFLFIQLSGLTLVFFAWQLSLQFIDPYECARFGDKCDGNLFLQVVAIGIWIGTIIYSSAAGWSELEKSNV